jgi:uncharacterized membrane protein YsdA (DUF1294 family)
MDGLRPIGVFLGCSLGLCVLACALGLSVPRAWLAGVNAVTFLAYGLDKRWARAGELRVPEATLHVLALAGGSPAALAAQACFRHKTRDRRFRWVFFGILLAQGFLLVALARA